MSLLDNLVSYWKLDEASGTRVDAHGSNDLSPTNAPGTSNGGVDLEASSSQYLAIADASQSGLDPSGSFSVAFEFNPESIVGDHFFFSKGDVNAGTRDAGYWLFTSTGGYIELRISDNGTLTATHNVTVQATSAGITAGNTYFIVFTFDAPTETATMYINGVSQSLTYSGSMGTTIRNSTDRFNIGTRESNGGGQSYFDGWIRKFAFWGERVLTSDDAAELWNSGSVIDYEDFGGGGATEYTLTAETGAFTLTGNAAVFPISRRLTTETGSFVLSGVAAALNRSTRIVAEAGAFVLTGIDASFEFGKRLLAETGSFTLTGNDVAFTRHYHMAAEVGSFALTGQDASFTAARTFTAETGAFTLTGNDIEFIFPDVYTMTAEAGIFNVTLFPPAFIRSYPSPLWINEAIPGGSWQAGQAGVLAGAEFFEGLPLLAGQLGVASEWDEETTLTTELTDPSDWIHDAVPGGTWFMGQPGMTAGASTFDGLEVFAGQLGSESEWENDAVE